MLGDDGSVDAAANIELSGQACKSRRQAANEIIENLVGHCLVKCALIAKGPDVKFQGFQLDTESFWDVFEIEGCKIGLPCLGTKTGEFRNANPNGVVACRIGIRKVLERIPGRSRMVV